VVLRNQQAIVMGFIELLFNLFFLQTKHPINHMLVQKKYGS